MLTVDKNLDTLLTLLACPLDLNALTLTNSNLNCKACGRSFEIIDGIPVLLSNNDKSNQKVRKTELFEESAEYFERVYVKRVKEWKLIPYLSETFQAADSWTLDVGTGAGILPLLNAKRGIFSVGMDVSLHGAKVGQAKARELGLTNCFFVVGDAVHLPFKSNAFQLVTNYTAIEHIYEPEACIRDMRRVLRPGGRLLLNTINNFSVMAGKTRMAALKDFLGESATYVNHLLGRDAYACHDHDDPASPTYENWKKGHDLDIYHARSYDLLEKTRRHFQVLSFTTHSYPSDGSSYEMTESLDVVKRPVSWKRRLIYDFVKLVSGLPFLKHIGRTTTIVGRKTESPPANG